MLVGVFFSNKKTKLSVLLVGVFFSNEKKMGLLLTLCCDPSLTPPLEVSGRKGAKPLTPPLEVLKEVLRKCQTEAIFPNLIPLLTLLVH